MDKHDDFTSTIVQEILECFLPAPSVNTFCNTPHPNPPPPSRFFHQLYRHAVAFTPLFETFESEGAFEIKWSKLVEGKLSVVPS
jgi:hypothetical protein